VRRAVSLTLDEDRIRTRDLGGRATTAEFARAVVKRVRAEA